MAGIEEDPSNLLITEAETILKGPYSYTGDLRRYKRHLDSLPLKIIDELPDRLSDLEEQTCNLAARLKREQQEVEAQKIKRGLWKNAFFGIGGAAIIGVNAALSVGLYIGTGDGVVPLAAASNTVGGGLIVKVF